MIAEVTNPDIKSTICNTILRSLPNWFGVPESIVDYTKSVRDMPFYACYANDGVSNDDIPIGFVAIKVHNTYTAEVCVMGILSEYHRMGIGCKLIDTCVTYCKEHGHRFLTVKTLADLSPDPDYAKTRAFYLAQGFCPLEVFPQIWDEANPCLFMAMSV